MDRPAIQAASRCARRGLDLAALQCSPPFFTWLELSSIPNGSTDLGGVFHCVGEKLQHPRRERQSLDARGVGIPPKIGHSMRMHFSADVAFVATFWKQDSVTILNIMCLESDRILMYVQEEAAHN
jgi:hypothetical protein